MTRLLGRRSGLILGGGSRFSPRTVAGLQLWLSADAGTYQDAARTTPAVANTDPVGAWADQSGQGHHLSQSTAGFRPLLELTQQNGKPSVRTDGVDDYLRATFTLIQPTQMVMVVKRGTLTILDGVTINSMTVFNSGGSNYTMYAGSNGPVVALDNTAFHVLSFLFNGATSRAAVDNGTPATGDVGAGNGGGLTVGARGDLGVFGVNDYAEILVYNSALSSANLTALAQYLGAKYGITVS